ncbi:MAG: hypothetical protein ABMA01_05945 [Chthoniobacteraceae bacterium]
MKKLLSVLMCFVFLQAQTFALRGGPNQGLGPQVQGAYSGILTDTTAGGTDIGLFILSAVNNGASNGQVVIFSQTVGSNSDFFSGILTGLTNPTNGSFSGLFGGTGQQNNGGSRTVTISGQMRVTATKVGPGLKLQGLTGTASSQTMAIYISGPTIGFLAGAPKTYSVSGWQTSSNSAGVGFALSGGN